MKTVFLIFSPTKGYLDGFNVDWEWISNPRFAWAHYPLAIARRRLANVRKKVADARLTDRRGNPIE